MIPTSRVEAWYAFVLAYVMALVAELSEQFWAGFHAGVRDYRARAVSMDRAQLGGGRMNIVGYFIGILVAGIVAIAVTIPVINDVLAQSNISGTTALVVGFIPVLIAVVLIVYVISPITGS